MASRVLVRREIGGTQILSKTVSDSLDRSEFTLSPPQEHVARAPGRRVRRNTESEARAQPGQEESLRKCQQRSEMVKNGAHGPHNRGP